MNLDDESIRYDAALETPTAAPPWPPAEGEAWVERLVRAWRTVMFEPTAFFQALRPHVRLGPALVFFLIVGVLGAGAELFWNIVFYGTIGDSAAGARLIETGVVAAPGDALVGFLLAPLLLVVVLFVSAAVTHVLLVLMGAGDAGYRGTAVAYAYAYAPAVLQVVPLLGALIAGVWAIVLSVVGLREVHGTTGWKAAVAVLLPVVLLFGVLVVLGVMAALLAGAAG